MTDLARRPGPVSRLRVAEQTSEGEREREDQVVAEEPLEIRMTWPGADARRAWVTMRTPGHDFELAAGWAFHEGLVGAGALAEVAYCTDEDLTAEQEFNVVTLRATGPVDLAHRHDAMSAGSSACGVCGKDSIEAALSTVRGPHWAGPSRGPTSYAGSRRCCGRSSRSSPGPVACTRPDSSPPTASGTSYARTWAGTTPSTRCRGRDCWPVSRPPTPTWW